MSNRHPPPTSGKKNGGPDDASSGAAAQQKSIFQRNHNCLGGSEYTREKHPGQKKTKKSALAVLIDQACRRDRSAPPGDTRHAAILAELKRLATRRAFGPRFGDDSHKPRMEIKL